MVYYWWGCETCIDLWFDGLPIYQTVCFFLCCPNTSTLISTDSISIAVEDVKIIKRLIPLCPRCLPTTAEPSSLIHSGRGALTITVLLSVPRSSTLTLRWQNAVSWRAARLFRLRIVMLPLEKVCCPNVGYDKNHTRDIISAFGNGYSRIPVFGGRCVRVTE